MPLPPDVCVRGAGVVGRVLALCLARDGLHVRLLDVHAHGHRPAVDDVRAYALNGASRELLQSLRAWPEAASTAVQRMDIRGDRDGRLRFDAASLGVAALAWIVDVPPLERALDEALRFQPRVERTAVDDGPTAALTVCCEGRDSDSRTRWGVDWQRLPYAQAAVATRLRMARPHGGEARQWFRGGEVLALLPMEGAQGNLVALVWSVPEERAGELISMDDGAFAQAVQTATLGTLGTPTPQGPRCSWPLQLAQAARWCGPGWALAGDAAHNLHPLAGQGLNLGLADAAELARVLVGREPWRGVGDVRLLRRYERARKAELALMRMATDGLQRLFDHDATALALVRNWGLLGFDRMAPLKAWAARQAMGSLT